MQLEEILRLKKEGILPNPDRLTLADVFMILCDMEYEDKNAPRPAMALLEMAYRDANKLMEGDFRDGI